MKNNYATIPWIFILFLTVIFVPSRVLAAPVLGFNALVQAVAKQEGFPPTIDGTNGYVPTQASAEATLEPTEWGYATASASVGEDSALGVSSYAESFRGVTMVGQGGAYVYNDLYVGGSGGQTVVEIALDIGGILEGTGGSSATASIFAQIQLDGSHLTPDYDNAYIVTPSGARYLDYFEDDLPFSLTPLGPGTNYTLTYEDSVDNTEGMVEIDLALVVPFWVDKDSVIQTYVKLVSDSISASSPGCLEGCPTARSSFGSTLEYQAFSPDGFELSWGSESTDVGRPTLSRDLSAVPVPAAVWLFGSGLIGLIEIGRQRKAA